ncbi:type I-E CRISPR-associated protein Cse1/CasA [Amycolatopsis sp. H20-H5]|uniref:type I-E CRISPR-associated protein Cse1/CasA n=1 Tax=Amycolatopsis sp. H20-H5 TaxID=3046309 RepID=UPI002DBD2BD0|nr:type I-E CRISPR-associated protein Cse1/CasA [Amycolatopsis sp. H20-H5]MEC3981983.1 type I-E CRISPR-associated protein Cse1/CasA [Amycolatopsis sp. H20-H5]
MSSASRPGRWTLFTWQSRRIRLAHTGERVTGVLLCNGSRLTPQNTTSESSRHSRRTPWPSMPVAPKRITFIPPSLTNQ